MGRRRNIEPTVESPAQAELTPDGAGKDHPTSNPGEERTLHPAVLREFKDADWWELRRLYVDSMVA